MIWLPRLAKSWFWSICKTCVLFKPSQIRQIAISQILDFVNSITSWFAKRAFFSTKYFHSSFKITATRSWPIAHMKRLKKNKKKLSSTSSPAVGFHMPCWRWLGIVAFFFIAEGKIKSRGRGSPTPRLFILLWYFRWHIWELQNIFIFFYNNLWYLIYTGCVSDGDGWKKTNFSCISVGW